MFIFKLQFAETQAATGEERMEMQAAFGKGTTVVNILTGEKTKL